MLIRTKCLAPEDSGGGSGGAPAPAPADAGITPQAPGDEPANPSKRELVDMRKELRDVRSALGSFTQMLQQMGRTPPAAPAESQSAAPQVDAPRGAQSSSEVAELRAELAFKDAVAERGIAGKQRKALERLWKSEQPQNLDGWLTETVESFGWGKGETPAATAAPSTPAPVSEPARIPPGTSNTGAPGADARTAIPTDIMLVDGGVFRAMSPEERRQRAEAFKRERTGSHNPFAARKTAK